MTYFLGYLTIWAVVWAYMMVRAEKPTWGETARGGIIAMFWFPIGLFGVLTWAANMLGLVLLKVRTSS